MTALTREESTKDEDFRHESVNEDPSKQLHLMNISVKFVQEKSVHRMSDW